jgi:tetratricopeptide (TPR) repeat protein
VVAHAATGSRQAAALAAPARLSAPAARPTTQSEQTVARLQSQLRGSPDDPGALGQLGLAYEQRARETADPAYYSKADAVLHRALALAPHDLVATSGLGSLALSRHRFGLALQLGRQALALSPSTSSTWGIIGDAELELGRYPAAFAAFSHMASVHPGLAAYARISYARELLGHPLAAAAAMSLAVQAAQDEAEPQAWTHVQLGKVWWSIGRYALAAREYRAALAAFPRYVYAEDALAQVEAARHHLSAALRLEQDAVNQVPLPQFVSVLGDLQARAGHRAEAARQYVLMGALRRLLAANGVRTDLEIALFRADHGLHAGTVALARAAQRARPSIDGDDALAWALARNGQCTAALPWSKRSLRLGTEDATKYFHRGWIERCLGHVAEGRTWIRRAVALNPGFSVLWAPTARRLAA